MSSWSKVGLHGSYGSNPGPLFRFSNGDSPTKFKFTQEVHEVLQALRLPYTDFAGHSFRIGAATAAARQEWRIH